MAEPPPADRSRLPPLPLVEPPDRECLAVSPLASVTGFVGRERVLAAAAPAAPGEGPFADAFALTDGLTAIGDSPVSPSPPGTDP